MKSIIYIGMDVHKNSYSLCALNANTGEIVQETTISPDVDKIVKFINSAKESKYFYLKSNLFTLFDKIVIEYVRGGFIAKKVFSFPTNR